MAAIGGPIESVSLDGRGFPVAADAESQRKIGGRESEVQPNGDGSIRVIQSRVPWSIDGLMLEADDSRGDHEFIQELSNRGTEFPVAITYASGITYQGKGVITGEVQAGSQNATVSVALMGSGELTRQ